MQSSFGSLESHFPQKKKRRVKKKKKTARNKKRLHNNYETLSDIPKKDPQKSQN
jgi:hypothetical protein